MATIVASCKFIEINIIYCSTVHAYLFLSYCFFQWNKYILLAMNRIDQTFMIAYNLGQVLVDILFYNQVII